MVTGASSGTIPRQILGDAALLAHEDAPGGQEWVPGRKGYQARRRKLQRAILRKSRPEGRRQRRDVLERSAEQLLRHSESIQEGMKAAEKMKRTRSWRSGGLVAPCAMLYRRAGCR